MLSRTSIVSAATLLVASSPAAFSHVYLITPDHMGGNELYVGETFEISWEIGIMHNTQAWHLYYSTTGIAGPWIPIEEDLPPGDISAGAVHDYMWAIPDAVGNEVSVRVVQDNATGTDYEDRSGEMAICRSPQNFCATSPNSAGPGATLFHVGSMQMSQNDFAIGVQGSAHGTTGLFYFGGDTSQIPFGDGFRCVGAGSLGTFRLGPAQASSPTGDSMRALDFDLEPGNMLPVDTSIFFQYWYRDTNGPGGNGFNLSNGLEVSFCL